MCGTNEEFTGCGSNCAVETCNSKAIRLCNRGCRRGCFCKTGYVRQADQTESPCIKREACIKKDAIVNTTCVYPRADILLDINGIRSFVAQIRSGIINACGGGNICRSYLEPNALDAVIDDISIVHNDLDIVHHNIYDCTK